VSRPQNGKYRQPLWLALPATTAAGTAHKVGVASKHARGWLRAKKDWVIASLPRRGILAATAPGCIS
jgi:hypothetical protein